MDNGFPKFQWSQFSGVGRSEQFVVRSNNVEELKEGIKKIKDLLDTEPDWLKTNSSKEKHEHKWNYGFKKVNDKVIYKRYCKCGESQEVTREEYLASFK